jgi:hypothetical protein
MDSARMPLCVRQGSSWSGSCVKLPILLRKVRPSCPCLAQSRYAWCHLRCTQAAPESTLATAGVCGLPRLGGAPRYSTSGCGPWFRAHGSWLVGSRAGEVSGEGCPDIQAYRKSGPRCFQDYKVISRSSCAWARVRTSGSCVLLVTCESWGAAARSSGGDVRCAVDRTSSTFSPLRVVLLPSSTPTDGQSAGLAD